MEKGSPKYWMSLEQWRNDPQFQELIEREFKTSPFAPEDANSGWARREFLKLMGASLALTSFGCVRQAQKIVPYAKRPEDIVPGIANYYASTVFDGNEVFGAVVKTREGRPIHIEGNESHPANRGGMSARAHAVLLNLYDPERLTEAKQNLLNDKKTNRDTIGISWEKLDEKVVEVLKAGKSAFLTGSLNSPSTKALTKQFINNFNMNHYIWEPLNHGSQRTAQKKSYGQEALPRPRFDKSKYTVALAADFLGTYLSPTEFTKQFSSSRQPNEKMSKLVVFEPTMSLTGSNADQRFRVRPSQLVDVAMGLAYQIVIAQKQSLFASTTAAREALEPFAEVYNELGIAKESFVHIAEELWRHRGQSLVITGGLVAETENAEQLHIAVNFLNSILGNDGKTIDYKNADYSSYQGSDEQLQKLVSDISTGKIKNLFIYGVNPIYSAPQALGLDQAFKKLENVIYIGTHLDETGLKANLVATEHHALENWGDAEVQTGVLSLQQPAIQPLYKTRSFQDSLLTWAKLANRDAGMNSRNWYDYLEAKWKTVHGQNRSRGIAKSDFNEFWFRVKQEGVFDTSNQRESESSARSFITSALKSINKSTAKDFEFVSYETIGLRDGSLANVAWLQEFSDPVTRISWDNYLCISPKTASVEKLQEGQVVQLMVGGIAKKVPIHIQPGQHDDVLALAVGYGRTAAGKVANGVGISVFDLAKVTDKGFVHSGLPIKLQKTDKFIPLANVQGHHTMEGRQIVVESTLEQYQKAPDKVVHKHKVFSLWDKHQYPNNKWAMSIDLNSCTGCGTCTIACQSENNIPTVGKKYLLQGREMTWIRIDRYYVGTPEDPDTVYQPVACLHCDNAPCETVCPVAATVHSDEGTNDMIYNRCVGTRYCANNCPYKVRRFNWFSYTTIESPLHMALNPEVTVRHRGVMEKCTFCVHRIKDKKREALAAAKEFKASEVKTACQQSCPANAIVFGDMNDPDSDVSKAFKDERAYSLLEELNTVPSLRYKYKVRNTDKLKGGDHHGHDSHNKGGHS
ncbi:MAG: TAT-variant-translocated molybdopterin oxidoreductase [Bdellovibrionales bacterium]|nr:TAT-variant-translocated molybdopterin oxidoreductase [Bdellovibrionales bacterium]